MHAHQQYRPAADEFKGRVILVTGATSGIGRALSGELVRYGATVILHGRRARALDDLYAELKDVGPEPAVACLDLERAQGPDYQGLTDEIDKRYGRLDGLVLNAGILGDRSPIEHYDIGMWQRVIHVNLNTQFILMRCLMPLLKQPADASVIFTTSGVGHRGRAHWGAYAASKFAIEGLSQVLADELENTSIRVNSVNPGGTRTSMRAAAYPGEDPKRLPDPVDVTPTYLYLLGPAGRDTRGQRLDCQG